MASDWAEICAGSSSMYGSAVDGSVCMTVVAMSEEGQNCAVVSERC